MLHLYSGADDYRLRHAYRALCDSLDVHGMLATNTTTLEPRGLRPQELIQHAAALPFLAPARVVVIEGLLAAAGGGQAAVRAWQPLLDALPQLPPTNHLVLLEPFASREQGVAIERSPLLRALRAVAGADVQEFRPLRAGGRDNEVAAWLRREAQARKTTLAPGAVEALVELVGPDLWMLAAELDKLARYAEGRAVTADDVRLLTPQAREQSIFDVVDAVVEGRAAPALLAVRRMLDEGSETPARIQSMIARQFRHLVRATELIEQGAEPGAIAEATGVRSDFPLGKLLRQAQAIPRSAAEAALRELEASEFAVKSGRRDEGPALDLLITRLATLARPAATR